MSAVRQTCGLNINDTQQVNNEIQTKEMLCLLLSEHSSVLDQENQEIF